MAHHGSRYLGRSNGAFTSLGCLGNKTEGDCCCITRIHGANAWSNWLHGVESKWEISPSNSPFGNGSIPIGLDIHVPAVWVCLNIAPSSFRKGVIWGVCSIFWHTQESYQVGETYIIYSPHLKYPIKWLNHIESHSSCLNPHSSQTQHPVGTSRVGIARGCLGPEHWIRWITITIVKVEL